MYDPTIRSNWDKSMKSMKIVEGQTGSGYVVHTEMHSPIFFISERDIVDKRHQFIHNNILFSITSSVEDDLIPIQNGIVRCKVYLNLFIMIELEDYYYCISFTQMDMKVIFTLF
jgi:hypothetical protein